MKKSNKCNIALFLWWSIIAVVVVLALVACNAEAATEFNSTNWADTSGTMLEHGDGNLRAPPSVTTGLVSHWNPGTDVGSGSTLTDIWGSNDGTIHGATWNMTSGMLEYNGTSDYVDLGFNLSNGNLSVLINAITANESQSQVVMFGVQSPTSNDRYYLGYDALQKLGIGIGSSMWYNEGNNYMLNTDLHDYTLISNNTIHDIYVDGLYQGQKTGTVRTSTSNYYIGAMNHYISGDFFNFNCSIGTTYIYNTAITNNQINETNAGYHNTTSYMETDSPIDAGAGYVNMYVRFNGTDTGSNTTIELQVKQNDTATWETAIADVTMNTNLTIPGNVQYQNASFRWFANTTYQPETDVLESVVFESGNAPSPQITLLSFTPDPLNTNYTGIVTISYLVESTNPLNLSSLAFLYGLNYTIPAGGDMQNFISGPANNIAYEGIYRAPHRNLTPYLSWEDNATITEGNVWKWGGYDNDSAEVSTSVINATHTYVNVTGVTEYILPSSFYLSKRHMNDAPKTGFEINRQQGLIFKMWNVEEIRNRDTNYLANMYFDTSWESTEPTYPIEIGYCNDSYDPATDDIDVSPYCTKFAEWNGTRWVNHSYDPGANASYASPLIVNASDFTSPSPDDINYIWLRSNTLSSKSFVFNATNYDPGITNITYAETNTMWTYNELNGITTSSAYTPSFFTTFARDYEELLHHLYIADDTGEWGHSEIFNESIGVSSVPVSPISFEHFCLTLNGQAVNDTDMDATYDDGSLQFNIHAPADPDGGSVDHNITLHYANNDSVAAIINNTLTTTGDEYVDISFPTTPHYSGSNYYTMRCVSTDDEGSVATRWLVSDFMLDADGNQGWIANGAVHFWGFNDIPSLYTTISNNSLMSYDAGDDIYTMHIPFFKSKYNDTFTFNETVHLKSLNDEDVSYFRFIGNTVFDNANIHAWNTTSDTPAPITDTYRGYVYSTLVTSGNIDNSNFSYLGSNLYRQEGLNFVGTTTAYTISNTVFSHNAEGPIFEECANFTISNSTITDNVNVGVGVYFSDDFIIENNIISSNGGRGVTLYEGDDNTIRYNDISDSGVHGIHFWSNSNNNTALGNDINGSALYDYYLSSSSTGNFILNPGSLTDKIRVTSTSGVNIENSNNMAFSEDSLATSYAYLTNFSMYVSGTSQTFDITQRDMTITPSNDNLSIQNFEWGPSVQFRASSDIGVNYTWFNITNDRWKNENVSIYLDGDEYEIIGADVSGSINYNYSVIIGDDYFEFKASPPTELIFYIFVLLFVLTIALSGYTILITDIQNYTNIITGFLSGVLWFILGYQLYIGIGFEHIMKNSTYSDGVIVSTEDVIEITTYQYPIFGMLFVIIAVIMILYSIVQAVNANKDLIEELEGKNNDY